MWFHLESGARRGGALALRVRHIDVEGQRVRLREKGESDDWQPVSRALCEAMLGHARERGGDDLNDDSPVLYYIRTKTVKHEDGTRSKQPWPLSRRRYNTLFDRLQRALPWADEIGARPHDLRATGGAWVERATSYAVAKKWLRHSVRARDVTGLYVAASDTEVTRAVELLTGGAPPVRQAPGLAGDPVTREPPSRACRPSASSRQRRPP